MYVDTDADVIVEGINAVSPVVMLSFGLSFERYTVHDNYLKGNLTYYILCHCTCRVPVVVLRCVFLHCTFMYFTSQMMTTMSSKHRSLESWQTKSKSGASSSHLTLFCCIYYIYIYIYICNSHYLFTY